MTGSYMTDADTAKWPIEVRLMDTQMGFMHALQTYVYEMGNMAMYGFFDSMDPERVQAVVECSQDHIETWHQLRSLVLATLREHADASKAADWEATTRTIDADMETCMSAMRDAMRLTVCGDGD